MVDNGKARAGRSGAAEWKYKGPVEDQSNRPRKEESQMSKAKLSKRVGKVKAGAPRPETGGARPETGGARPEAVEPKPEAVTRSNPMPNFFYQYGSDFAMKAMVRDAAYALECAREAIQTKEVYGGDFEPSGADLARVVDMHGTYEEKLALLMAVAEVYGDMQDRRDAEREEVDSESCAKASD
jgi:hypothetical protein